MPVVSSALDDSGCISVFSAVHDAFFEEPVQPTGGRDSHCRVLRGAEILHTRFGVTDPAVFRALRTSATGIELPEVPTTRYTSLAYVQQASVRTAVRHEKLLRANPRPGESASLDFTRSFVRDLDDNVCASVVLDIATYSL